MEDESEEGDGSERPEGGMDDRPRKKRRLGGKHVVRYRPLGEQDLNDLHETKQARPTLGKNGAKIGEIDAEMEKMTDKVDLGSIEKYNIKKREYRARWADHQQMKKTQVANRTLLEEWKRRRLNCFLEGFSTITDKVKQMYRMLTFGGDAELELVDSLDPFSEGVQFSVRPPNKSWKHIQNLSGGEKTLASMSLVFALHHYRPTPIYCMDEIDAALDHRNVSIVANYIKDQTKNAQFIIISLRNNTFELANRLVGIYKTDNISKSITIDPRKFESAFVDQKQLRVRQEKLAAQQREMRAQLAASDPAADDDVDSDAPPESGDPESPDLKRARPDPTESEEEGEGRAAKRPRPSSQ